MKPRLRARVDNNQQQIVKELRQAGFKVQPGHDDLLVYRNHLLLWVEVKNPERRRKRTGKIDHALEDSQKRLREEFGDCYLIADNTEDILDWFAKRIKGA